MTRIELLAVTIWGMEFSFHFNIRVLFEFLIMHVGTLIRKQHDANVIFKRQTLGMWQPRQIQ